jgi:hypothetical protein
MRRTIALLHPLIPSHQKDARLHTVTQAMSMNDLPLELTARVVSYLALLEAPNTKPPYAPSKPRLSQYACTSFSLQSTIERHLFSRLTLKSNDLLAFEALVARSTRRRALLRSLCFQPVLPAYEIHACAQFEKLSDQQANNEAFTATLKHLYTILHACDEVEGGNPLALHLRTPFAPSDKSHNDWDKAEARRRGWLDSDRRREVWKHRHQHSYLRLEEQTDLAASNRITTFSLSADGPRYVAPASVFALLKCHNKLKSLDLELHDNERKSPDLRIQLRTTFARCLRDIRCSTLTDLCLSYRYEDPSDHRFVNADVRDCHGGSTQDALSTSLHQLLVACRKLKRIHLKGRICIDEHVFWIDDPETAEPLWPDLKHVLVHMSAVRPDGGWYLDSYPGVPLDKPIRVNDMRSDSSDSDSDGSDMDSEASHSPAPDKYNAHREGLQTGDAYELSFRSEPNESLERVLHAAARAAERMPNLLSMYVTLPVPGCPRTGDCREAFAFMYQAKGVPQGRAKVPLALPELHWEGPSGWKMNESLEETWRTMLGSEGQITYDEW